MQLRVKLICSFFVLFLFLVSCSISENDNAGEVVFEELNAEPTGVTFRVDIINGAFESSLVEIEAGDSVVWNNNDLRSYSVTLENGDFEAVIAAGERAEYVFGDRGEFRYFDVEEPSRYGTVIVR